MQVLSEQVNAQNDKMADLERLINDKSQLITSTEDLLQRVRKETIFILASFQIKYFV